MHPPPDWRSDATSVKRPLQPTGYSGTPLVDKLGIKPEARVRFVGAPRDFFALLGPPASGAWRDSKGDVDFAMVFVRAKADLEKEFPPLRDKLVANGMLWVAWPKKASGVQTDLTEDVVRGVGLHFGLVDVKVCAVDATWSGLKFVRRLKDR